MCAVFRQWCQCLMITLMLVDVGHIGQCLTKFVSGPQVGNLFFKEGKNVDRRSTARAGRYRPCGASVGGLPRATCRRVALVTWVTGVVPGRWAVGSRGWPGRSARC